MRGSTIINFFDFNLSSASVIEKKNHFLLEITGYAYKFYFEPVDKGQVTEWAEFIRKILQETDGVKNNYTYLATKVPRFFETEVVPNEYFEKNANSGDIILFRSEHGAARVQQFITNSEYDHVAVILRNQNNELFMFESTSD